MAPHSLKSATCLVAAVPASVAAAMTGQSPIAAAAPVAVPATRSPAALLPSPGTVAAARPGPMPPCPGPAGLVAKPSSLAAARTPRSCTSTQRVHASADHDTQGGGGSTGVHSMAALNAGPTVAEG